MLRNKLENDAAEAAKQAEDAANVRLMETEQQIQVNCEEVVAREIATYQDQKAKLEYQQQEVCFAV